MLFLADKKCATKGIKPTRRHATEQKKPIKKARSPPKLMKRRKEVAAQAAQAGLTVEPDFRVESDSHTRSDWEESDSRGESDSNERG